MVGFILSFIGGFIGVILGFVIRGIGFFIGLMVIVVGFIVVLVLVNFIVVFLDNCVSLVFVVELFGFKLIVCLKVVCVLEG